jgi:hypothetical protein
MESCLRTYFKTDTNTAYGRVIYAILVTVFAIVVALAVSSFNGTYNPTQKLF